MATLTVELSDELLAKIERTGRPAQEVIVAALEQTLNGGLATTEEEVPREKVTRKLIESGTVIDPSTWDDSYAQAWLARPEDERKKLIEEMNREWHPGSLASKAVIEGRR